MENSLLSQQHRNNILALMQMCHLDLHQAQQLYINSHYNLQAAIQNHFNPPEQHHYHHQHHQHNQYEDDEEYIKYKEFMMSGIGFYQRYQVRRHQGLLKRYLVPSFLKSKQSAFKTKLENFLQKKLQIYFGVGYLSENIQYIWSNRIPLILHLYDLNPATKPILNQLLTDPFLTEVFNTHFRSYGIYPPEYELEPELQHLINYQSAPCLIALRVDITQKIRLIDKIPLTNLNDIKHKLKIIKSNSIQTEIDEMHTQRQYEQQLMGNYDYQKPMSNHARKKLIEDRLIRQKQQQQYSTIKTKVQTPVQPVITTPPKQSRNEILSKRQKKREEMMKYQQGMVIKLRLPSGQSIKMFVNPQQKINYLFDFVECYQTEIGFEDENNRNFEILRPYDKLHLSQLKDKLLKEVFEESEGEILAVMEK